MEQSQLDARRAGLFDTTTTATADLVGYYQTIQNESPDAVAAQLRAAAPAVVAEYGEIAGTMAADWYEQTRPVTGFLATTATPSIADALPGMLGWALQPLFADTGSDALTRLVGGVQRLVALFDRSTIDLNATRDPLAGTSKRLATSSACAFCIYMAVATDAEHGHYHDHCNCLPAPEWKGDALPSPPEAWQNAYESAYHAISRGQTEIPDWYSMKRKERGAKYPELQLTTKNIVARMRESLGTH